MNRNAATHNWMNPLLLILPLNLRRNRKSGLKNQKKVSEIQEARSPRADFCPIFVDLGPIPHYSAR